MPVKTGYYIRVINNEVVEVWDTPAPAGQDGWSDAIEIFPEINDKRETITTHSFDITKTPMEIIWGKRDLTVEERKGQLIGQAEFILFPLQRQLEMATIEENAEKIADLTSQIEAATVVRDERVAVINAAVTHEDVDALL